MSYSVSLYIDTGGPEPVYFWDTNYTSNTSRMWYTAGIDLAAMDGKPASEVEPLLTGAIDIIAGDPEKYRPMQPDNGWGTYETCLSFLRSIRDACAEHPKATLRVSH